jgi:hypothetical protein
MKKPRPERRGLIVQARCAQPDPSPRSGLLGLLQAAAKIGHDCTIPRFGQAVQQDLPYPVALDDVLRHIDRVQA